MLSPLWMSIEPQREEVRLMLSEPLAGTILKARLCSPPANPRAVLMLLEALSAWYRLPLHAVFDADAPGVRAEPEYWTHLLDEIPGVQIRVEFAERPRAGKTRDRFLSTLGDFTSGRRLINHTATGQP